MNAATCCTEAECCEVCGKKVKGSCGEGVYITLGHIKLIRWSKASLSTNRESYCIAKYKLFVQIVFLMVVLNEAWVCLEFGPIGKPGLIPTEGNRSPSIYMYMLCA